MTVGAIPSGNGVEAAIRRASTSTGVDFDFLVRTANRESSMNPMAKARSSSASGLFQFIEQTWLGTVKQHGAKHGYGRYADLINRGTDGRWQVQGSARNMVLDLRFDAQASSAMAAEFTAANAAYLRGRTGVEPGAGDLYAAHFLGAAGAARLIEAFRSRPDASAAALFPDAASANRSIFYRNGRSATVAEVYANLNTTAGMGAPAAGVSENFQAPDLSDKDLALAARLDRLRQDQSLLALLLNQEGNTNGGGFGGAFGPTPEVTG